MTNLRQRQPQYVKQQHELPSHQRMHCRCLDQRSTCRTGLAANNTGTVVNVGTCSLQARSKLITYTVRLSPPTCQAHSSTPWSRYTLPNTRQSTVQWHSRTCQSDTDYSYRPSRSGCTVPLDTANQSMPSLPHCTRTQHWHCRCLSKWTLSDPSCCRTRLVDTGSTRPDCRCCIDPMDTVVPSTAPLQRHSTNQQERCSHQSKLVMLRL